MADGNKLGVNNSKACVINIGSRHNFNPSRDLRLNDVMFDEVVTVPYLGFHLINISIGTTILTLWSQSYLKMSASLST